MYRTVLIIKLSSTEFQSCLKFWFEKPWNRGRIESEGIKIQVRIKSKGGSGTQRLL
jgi:hypothetical protein